ncbi:related to sac1-recessive suppressor ofsecretory defect [Lichtheimia corymbifera JMRC:FSU:9682]|uniref:Related to sac1-recessive suppressor ofsecretory defect n=1 Tax=Lichtheimia corymbifera JMRC:FSU:9682 TaxID=1263082 RepID=A0A068SF85_9FUNG|nr:related to sac1-recessive suppressor ofsecretory defect [Lichtheimia corymbifera JMRC:FSU:9682]
MKVPESKDVVDDKPQYMIQLHVLDNGFVLVNNDNQALLIHFNGSLTRLESTWEPPKEAHSYEVYGVVGLLDGVREKYLVVITRARILGRLFGYPVYVIEQVACLDLNARLAKERLDQKIQPVRRDSDSESEEDEDEDDNGSSSAATTLPKTSVSSPTTTSSSPAATVSPTITALEEIADHAGGETQRPGLARPFMNRFRWSLTGSSNNIKKKDKEEKPTSPVRASSSQDLFTALAVNENLALEKRIVKQVTELFSRSMFIYAPGYDITNSFQRTFESQQQQQHNGEKDPIWKQVDKRFWWNEHLCHRFKSLGLDEWIMPIMQGTMQIEECEIEGYHFDFVLISRRSRERAGMRYQRRGINEQGEVANFVETEQAVIFYRDNIPHIASFVQTRGSIPLFWSQSPYSLHPVPVLERSEEENNLAFERHFTEQEKLYGRQVAVNLTELSGREAIVGSEYRRHVEHLADPNIKYVEFDFHRETKGMRFENISKLSTSLRNDLAKIAHFWQAGEKIVYCKQNGVFRTNCMDCLDRTNVVQSAFARVVLNQQLMRFGISECPDEGIHYYESFERIFNHVWANNGDMISRMYAGTSALKGDFTRTGKRNITGMMNDASNSLARMYLNTVKDFWRQATIDYILGYHKIEIFRHVPQSTLMSAEPGMERRWAKIRMDAIEISSAIVIADDEIRLGGWTLLSPNEPQKRRAKKFEEKVVLLTTKALYVCSYNYKLEKVVQFRRIELHMLLGIQTGEYILSSTTPQSRDIEQNYGFLLYYDADHELTRMNTGSIRNQNLGDLNIGNSRRNSSSSNQEKPPSIAGSAPEEEEEDDSSDSESDKEEEDGRMFLAFKAVRYNVLGELSDDQQSCRKQVQEIAYQISKACGQENDPQFLYDKPIISIKQAENTDGIFKKMGLKIKHAMWM